MDEEDTSDAKKAQPDQEYTAILSAPGDVQREERQDDPQCRGAARNQYMAERIVKHGLVKRRKDPQDQEEEWPNTDERQPTVAVQAPSRDRARQLIRWMEPIGRRTDLL